MNESVNESEKKAFGLKTNDERWPDWRLDELEHAVMNLIPRVEALEKCEERVIALERALEALLKKEEMSKLNLHGGDGEWY
jgi:hypothetical protein